jgi:hypothetical protein
MNVQPGTLARSLLAGALDGETATEPQRSAAELEVGDLQAPASTADPEVELLANGDLLVPVAADNGDWRITRLEPETPGYGADGQTGGRTIVASV